MEEYQRPIYFYLLKILNGNVQDAEDMTAETFATGYLKLTSFNLKLKFSSWLYRIAHNKAVDLIRKNRYNYIIDIDKLEISDNKNKKLSLEFDLQKILQFLDPKDRSILIMKYIEELKNKEIAEVLNIKPNAVGVKLHRAITRAKKIINQRYARRA